MNFRVSELFWSSENPVGPWSVDGVRENTIASLPPSEAKRASCFIVSGFMLRSRGSGSRVVSAYPPLSLLDHLSEDLVQPEPKNGAERTIQTAGLRDINPDPGPLQERKKRGVDA